MYSENKKIRFVLFLLACSLLVIAVITLILAGLADDYYSAGNSSAFDKPTDNAIASDIMKMPVYSDSTEYIIDNTTPLSTPSELFASPMSDPVIMASLSAILIFILLIGLYKIFSYISIKRRFIAFAKQRRL